MKTVLMHTQSKKDPHKLDFWSVFLPIAFDLVCGLLLILLGGMALRVTSYVLSGLMILFAAWNILTYFRSEPMERITHSFLAIGLALAVAGVLLAFNPDYLQDALPFVWGLVLLFGAFLKCQYAFDLKTVRQEKWWIMLIFAAFSLMIGVICLLNSAVIEKHQELLIGIMLLAEAVLDVVVFFLLSSALKKVYPGPAAAAGKAEVPAPDSEPEVVPDSEPKDVPGSGPDSAPDGNSGAEA